MKKIILASLITLSSFGLTAACKYDPLIIDLGQDGLHLGPKGVGVMFDLTGNGEAEKMQWTAFATNDAFLIMDRNENGIVDDGSELFTNHGHSFVEGQTAANGFVHLGQHDDPQMGGNNDGVISSEDNIWQHLSLWLDIDANGISTANEIYTLEEKQITTINVIPKRNHVNFDHAGNVIPYWSWTFTNEQGNNRMKMYDVYFDRIE